MPRYIDADKARDNSADPYVRIYLDSQPTADVAPVVHGHWIYKFQTHDGGHCYECSVCGRYERVEFKTDIANMPHCHCGAKMDEGAKQ